MQPYVALGAGLRAAGHAVRMVTLAGFEELIRGRGLDHLVVGESPRAIAGTEAGQRWVQRRTTAGGFVSGFVGVASRLIESGSAAYWNAGQHAEALIVAPMGLPLAVSIAEKLHIPLIHAQLAPPVVPTRYDWDGHRTVWTAGKGVWNVSLHRTFHFTLWTLLRGAINRARTRVLGLPALPLAAPIYTRRPRETLLGGYSAAVVPRPPDWGNWLHVTGYWFLDETPDWTPPPELQEFLAAGPPPVFVGFGSTPFPNPEAAAGMVVRALQRAGQRGVVLAGGSGLPTGRLSGETYSLDTAPHSWLFPRVCAAVHHGGAGVTGAALRAGLPSVVVPVFADQPFWGERVFRLGAGPRPIPARRLNEDSLTEAIRVTSRPGVRGRAREIGALIRREDGIARAVEILEKEFAGARHAS